MFGRSMTHRINDITATKMTTATTMTSNLSVTDSGLKNQSITLSLRKNITAKMAQ
jgi:hypothetical protein